MEGWTVHTKRKELAEYYDRQERAIDQQTKSLRDKVQHLGTSAENFCKMAGELTKDNERLKRELVFTRGVALFCAIVAWVLLTIIVTHKG